MDPPFAIRVFSYQSSHFNPSFPLFLGFHFTLKQYGGWIRPVQLRCHYSTVKCVISLHETFQMWYPRLTNMGGSFPCNTDTIFIPSEISSNSVMLLIFRCDWDHWPLWVDHPFTTQLEGLRCSTIHPILQWFCLVGTHTFLKNNQWLRETWVYLLMSLQEFHYWIFLRFAYHSQHPQGSWHYCCMVFPGQYHAMVHRIRGPHSVSETHQITL